MDSIKKHKLKEWFKKKKKLFIGFGVFAVLGAIALVVGCYMSGSNIVEWFTGPFAMTVYILVSFGLIVLAAMFYLDFIRRKGQ